MEGNTVERFPAVQKSQLDEDCDAYYLCIPPTDQVDGRGCGPTCGDYVVNNENPIAWL